MADTNDVLIHIREEDLDLAKQAEDQRATMTNLVVIIASIIQGVLTQIGFVKNALPLAILLILLGIFGLIASAKQFEREKFHRERVSKIRHRLDELNPDAQIQASLEIAGKEHRAKHRFLSRKIHLNKIWLTLHTLIIVLGVIYLFIILLR